MNTAPQPPGPSGREHTDDSDRLSSVERDVYHLGTEFGNFRSEVRENFAGLRRMIEAQRQPLTAFAGWAAVLIALGGAVFYPLLKDQDRQLQTLEEIRRDYASHTTDGHPQRIEERIDANKENQMAELSAVYNTSVARHAQQEKEIARILQELDKVVTLFHEHDARLGHVGVLRVTKDLEKRLEVLERKNGSPARD